MASYPDFQKNTGWGDILGLEGVNCRHSWGSYEPGISMPPPSQEELAEQHKRDTETKHYKWKDSRGVEHERDFTYRDALDRQRELERQMRNTRAKANAYKEAELNEEYTIQKARYQSQRAEYKKFSTAMGIDTNFERIYMDRFRKNIGRIRSGIMVTHVYKGIPVYDDDGNLKYVQPVRGIVADDGKTYKGVLSKDSRGNRFVYNQVPNDYIEPPTPTDPFVSIELTTLPTKMFYNLDDTIDLTGGMLTATRQSGATTEISLPNYQVRIISGNIVDSVLVHNVTLAFNGLTTSFQVAVQAYLTDYNIFGKTVPEKTYENMVSNDMTKWVASTNAVINSITNNVINFTATAQYGAVLYTSTDLYLELNRKYYWGAMVRTTGSNSINVKITSYGVGDLGYSTPSITSTTLTKTSGVITNASGRGRLRITVQNGSTANWVPAEVNEKTMCVDITNIPEIAGMTDAQAKTWCDTHLVFRADGKVVVVDPVPSPDYPVTFNWTGKKEGETILRSASRNLFDKNNYNIKSLNATAAAGSSGVFSVATNQKHVFIRCLPNTTYTVTKPIENNTVLGIYETIESPAVDVEYKTLYFSSTSTGIRTITTSANVKYLSIRINTAAITQQEIDSIVAGLQIEEGSTATDYVPFGEHIVNIPVELRNLPNGVADDLYYQRVGETLINNTSVITINQKYTNKILFRIASTNVGILATGLGIRADRFAGISFASAYGDNNIEGIAIHNTTITANLYLSISKSRLIPYGYVDGLTDTQIIAILRLWLIDFPILAQYLLAEPIPQNLTLPKLKDFGEGTTITSLNEIQPSSITYEREGEIQTQNIQASMTRTLSLQMLDNLADNTEEETQVINFIDTSNLTDEEIATGQLKNYTVVG